MSRHHTTGVISEDARRRRPTTACATCRERRVKCDRVHPVCSACKKGRHHCKYPANPATTALAFVPESHCASIHAPSSVDTWSEVIQSQADLAQQPVRPQNDAGDGDPPAWGVRASGQNPPASDPMVLAHAGTPLAVVGPAFVSALRSGLPDHREGMSLLDSYLRNCHPLVPICDASALRTLVPLLWRWDLEQIAIDTVLLTLAVLYAEASTSQHVMHARHAQTFSTLYKDLTARLEFVDYFIASPSMPLLQAFVLHGTFRACHLAPFAAFGFLPQAIRFAQILGLHRDQEAPTPTEREVRRRMWWHLVFLDVEATISSGLQSIIRPNGHNTPLPSPTIADLPVTDTAEAGSPVLAAMQGHWLLAQIMHPWFEQRPTHDEILGFSRTIKRLAAGIRGESAMAKWAHLYLQLQIDRAYCMLGLRFWQLDQFQRTSCHGEVVSTARSFLNSYLDLVTLGRDVGLAWFVPGFLQPLHALIILLKHLSGCSSRATENAAGSYTLINQVIDARREWIMRGPIRPLPAQLMPSSGGGGFLTPMTDSRYRMLWTLKEQVWKRFGWTAATATTMETTTGSSTAMLTSFAAPGHPTEFPALSDPRLSHQTQGHAEDFNLSALDHSSVGDPRAAVVADRYFDIDNLIPPDLLSPVQWDTWLLDFYEADPGSHHDTAMG